MGRKLIGLTLLLMAAFLISGYTVRAEEAPAPPEGPLTLEECINIALGGHPKIKGAEQDLDAGHYATMQATSAFWPSVDFNANRNYINYERQIRIGSESLTTTAKYISNNFAFNTNWTLFDFGRTYYRVRGLAELEGSLLNSLNVAEQAVAYDVMDAYFGLLSAQSLVDVAKETKDAADVHLKQAQAFYDVGVKPRFDVTQAEVEVNDAKLKLIQAQDAVKVARVSLNTKLGFRPLTETEVEVLPVTEQLGETMDGYIEMAMSNRPELKGQEFQVRSAQAGVKGAFSDLLPTLSASANEEWYKEDHSDMLSNQNVSISVNVPIFEGLKTLNSLAEARARLLSANYKLEDLKRDVTLEVSKSYLDVEDAKARIDALETSVKKAKENLEIAQGRYEAGVGPLIEVTDARVGLTSAETDLATATYDYHTAYAKLLKSIGTPLKGGGQAE